MVRGPRRVTATVETTAASPDAAVVEVIGVRKRFGATLAVDGVDLALRCGEVFGLVGTNGGVELTLTSKDSLRGFIGNSFEVISRRPR